MDKKSVLRSHEEISEALDRYSVGTLVWAVYKDRIEIGRINYLATDCQKNSETQLNETKLTVTVRNDYGADTTFRSDELDKVQFTRKDAVKIFLKKAGITGEDLGIVSVDRDKVKLVEEHLDDTITGLSTITHQLRLAIGMDDD